MALWKKLGSGVSSATAFKRRGISASTITTSDASDTPLIENVKETKGPVSQSPTVAETSRIATSVNPSEQTQSSEENIGKGQIEKVAVKEEQVQGVGGTELDGQDPGDLDQKASNEFKKHEDEMSSKKWRKLGGRIMTVNLLKPKVDENGETTKTHDKPISNTVATENKADSKAAVIHKEGCRFAMKEKVLSKKSIISAVNGFKGKKIVGLRDTLSDAGAFPAKRGTKLKHKSDGKQGKSKRNVSFNPENSVREFKKSAVLQKNVSKNVSLKLGNNVGKDKFPNKSGVIRSPSSKDEQYISPPQNSEGTAPDKTKSQKKIVRKKPIGNNTLGKNDTRKERKVSVTRKITADKTVSDNKSEGLKETSSSKKNEHNDIDPQKKMQSQEEARKVKRLHKKGKTPEKEAVQKKVDSAAKLKWRKMGVIIKLASTLEKGQPPSLLMMTQGGKESVENSLKTSLMIQNYQTLRKPKLGAVPRNGGCELDRFRQHTQEKRHHGMGEVFIHPLAVRWQGDESKGGRDPKGISSFVKLPWEAVVQEPECLSGANHSFSCLFAACSCTLTAPITGGLHSAARNFLYTLLVLTTPLLACLLGSYLGFLLFLQVWLIRPLEIALAMQAKLIKDCCKVVVADLVCLPFAAIGRVIFSTSRSIDLATLASPLSSVFLGKAHSVDWSLPTTRGAGRSSLERYPGQKRARLPFTFRPSMEQVLGRVMRAASRMAAAHREWLAQVDG